eukprot:6189341-Pleurochrysis_carterae.AAC.5
MSELKCEVLQRYVPHVSAQWHSHAQSSVDSSHSLCPLRSTATLRGSPSSKCEMRRRVFHVPVTVSKLKQFHHIVVQIHLLRVHSAQLETIRNAIKRHMPSSSWVKNRQNVEVSNGIAIGELQPDRRLALPLAARHATLARI